MMPAPGWFFGGRNPLEDPIQNPLGGFNVSALNPTSPMPSLSGSQAPQPAAGVSGTPAGQPPVTSPAGGMTFGPPQDQGAADSGPAAAPSGPGFSVGEAADVANNGGSLSLGGVGPGTISTANMASGLVGGLLGIPGTSIPMGPALAPFSLANTISSIAANNMGDPAIVGIDEPSIATGNPNASDPSVPAVGNVNTSIGRAIAAIQGLNNGPQPDPNTQGGFSGFGGNGSTVSPAGGIFSSLGVPTGNVAVAPANTEYSDISPQVTTPDPTTPDPETPEGTGQPGEPGGPAGPAGPAGTVGDGTAGGIGGSAPGGEGGAGVGSSGDGSGGGGPAGGGAGAGDGAFRKGGKVQRPDPRKLAEMLKRGSTVQVGSKQPGQDDVNVRLSRGEEVVNKNATDKFGPILDAMNRLGNLPRQGGFAVGQPGRPRMVRR